MANLVINKHSCNLVKEKSDLIFELWFTRVTFESNTETNEEGIEIEQTEQWLSLSAKENQDIEKAKEYIKSLCNPDVAEITDINANMQSKLNEIFLNQLIGQYQVHIEQLSGKTLIVQGKKENVMKCLIDLNCKPFCVGSNLDDTIAQSTLNDIINDKENDDDNDILWLENMKTLTPKSYSKLANKALSNDKKIQKDNQSASSNNKINDTEDDTEKKFIIIDGSNVAVEHGKSTNQGKCFSCRGIKLACEYFRNRGHKNVVAIVPRFRRGTSDHKCKTIEPEILDELEENGFLTYTPSRYDQFKKKYIFSYDDIFILKAAANYDAIIVSNDNYRDLQQSKPEWRELISKNLLQFSFVGNLFMVADDPLGRNGPGIDEFLSKKSNSKLNGMIKPKTSSNELNQKQNRPQNTNKSKKNSKKSELNSLETEGGASSSGAAAVVFDVDSDNSEIEDQIRDEGKSGELFIKLIEMFPESGDKISTLLCDHQSTDDIDFFIHRLLN